MRANQELICYLLELILPDVTFRLIAMEEGTNKRKTMRDTEFIVEVKPKTTLISFYWQLMDMSPT